MAAKNFIFSSVPNILCKLGSSAEVGSIVKNLGAKRKALIVTDPGLRKLGLTDQVAESLEIAGLKCTVFDQVKEDPPENIVLDLVQEAKISGVDSVVGVGGGSSMDVAKLVAFLCGNTKQSLNEVYGVDLCVGNRLPLVQVPTTAGTGSEVTNISVITTGKAEKKGVVSSQLYADYAVVDARLTLTVPPKITAATGIDAMVHAIEAYISKFKKNMLSDVLAKEALKLLSSNIRQACADGNDLAAREGMLLGSLLAGMAFSNSPCAAVHALAYPIGSHFHVPHGLSNSLMLPHVIRFNGEMNSVADMYKDLNQLIFPELVKKSGAGYDVMANGFADLAADLKIPTSLREVGIKSDDIDLLATEGMKVTRLLNNNPRTVNLEDAHHLYSLAFNN